MIAIDRPVPVRSSVPRARAAARVAMDGVGLTPGGHGAARFHGPFQCVLGAFDAETCPLARR